MEVLNRRSFIKNTGLMAASSLLAPLVTLASQQSKKRVAMVGTGGRGIGMWGAPVQEEYQDILEFVGLCDINPGRVAYAKERMKASCPMYTDLDKIIKDANPDTFIVSTTDVTNHEYIIKGREGEMTVISEEPMTTDEQNCQAIFDAERRTRNKLV